MLVCMTLCIKHAHYKGVSTYFWSLYELHIHMLHLTSVLPSVCKPLAKHKLGFRHKFTRTAGPIKLECQHAPDRQQMNKHTHGQMRPVHNTHQTFISGRAFLFDQDQFIHLPALRLSTYAWKRLSTPRTESTLNRHFACRAQETKKTAKLALAINKQWQIRRMKTHNRFGSCDAWKHR